jgi:hypothetical protein
VKQLLLGIVCGGGGVGLLLGICQLTVAILGQTLFKKIPSVNKLKIKQKQLFFLTLLDIYRKKLILKQSFVQLKP